MREGFAGALTRIWALALIALAIWGLTIVTEALPPALPADAPAADFSALRAEAVLARLLGPERPHPASSAENAAVRARILSEYASMGIKAVPYRALGCNMSRRSAALLCGTVTDVMADVTPGPGKAIVLLAHYDSVPAGPGASDDESGDATIFETIRALKARGGADRHPIIALNTDGEEDGLLGAAAALDDPAFKSRVGAVVNVEARGNQGPSLLFQTSPGDGPLVDLYARSTSRPATSSLFSVIYKLLPNDTDLTLFIRDGFLSYNFAFSGNVAHYHTALDRRANLDPRTLQMHGDNMLGVVSSLEHTAFASLKHGRDDIYLTLFGRFLPRISANWALPLALALFVLLVTTLWVGQTEPVSWTGWLAAFSILPLLAIGAALLGWGLHEIAVLVSGQPDPSYAHPWALRIALAFGVWSVTLLVSRLAAPREAALGVSLFYAAIGILTAQFLTGLSPYFLFPLVIAAPLVVAQAFFPNAWKGPAAQIALLVAALPALLIWMSLVIMGETVMGLALHPLFTIPAAFALAPLVPVVAGRPLPRAAWAASAGISLAAAAGFAVVAGTLPAYSAIAPQRLDIFYVEDAVHHRNLWATTATAPLPPSLRAAAPFSAKPEQLDSLRFSYVPVYLAPAGAARFAPPSGDVRVSDGADGARRASIALRASGAANEMMLMVPQSAKLKAIDIDGKHFDVPPSWAKSERPAFILCATDDCATKTITLTLGTAKPVNVTLVELRYGLPPAGAKLQAARPATAVVSQTGDATVLVNDLRIPPA